MEGYIIEVKTKVKNVNTYNESSLFINLQDTMNRIEIVISSTKTIDMKAEEMIIKYVVSNGTTTERLNDSDVIILMNDFANKRVIEELEKIKGLGVTYTDDVIDKRIKELKQ
jgi:hypothetical protein